MARLSREDCGHCHVLSHSSFDLCPYCGQPKDYEEDVFWTNLEFHDQEATIETLPGGDLTVNDTN